MTFQLHVLKLKGDTPGTTTELVRGSNQLNWAILLNTRPANPDALGNAVDALVWNVLPSIKAWPSHDLFAATTAAGPVARRAAAMGRKGFARARGRLVIDAGGKPVDARGAVQAGRKDRAPR